MLTRSIAVVAVVAAVLLVAVLMFGGGSGYHVTADFINASQLVKGNLVEVGGRQVGKVEDIGLEPNGLAKVKIGVDGDFSPLHEGTKAVIRVNSLSGIANRYVALTPGPSDADPIRSGGKIPTDDTQSAVDLDQIFNTLDASTRRGLQNIIKGTASQLNGKGTLANDSLRYLAPALSSTSQLTQELAADQVEFQRFVTDTSNVVSTIASRGADLSALVGNANATTRAIGDENVSLSQALNVLPDTLRNGANTFAGLRTTLNDLDPLVNESKPATKRLAPFFADLRPLLRDAEPTVRDLSTLIRQKGANNDLIDLLTKQPRLASLVTADFPHTIKALQKGQPVIDFVRPYAPEFTGWLTKFAESASPYDANGHYARVSPYFGAFAYSRSGSSATLTLQPNSQRMAGLESGRANRCPGAGTQPSPDGSSPFLDMGQLGCDASNVPPGP
jgi:phospholipid/cholesterol/gamma-HCH transport system substrate-binding protein